MVLECLRLQKAVRVAGVTDPDRAKKSVAGVPVLGGDEVLAGAKKRGIRGFAVGLGSVGDNGPRADLYRRGLEAGLEPVRAVHPSAVIAETAVLGPGTMVFPCAVVNPAAVVGANVIVNTSSVVEHHVRIADHAHVGPRAVLCGRAEVGEGAFIGAGAVVIQGVRIGAWAVVGAGSTVLDDVPDGARVVGVPAVPIGKRRR
jgi:UDP-perosamine 4-acetyltransferase